MLSHESYVALLMQVDELISVFEQHPDEATRERLFALLTGLDMVHREGLTRLVNAMREMGAGNLIERATVDPIVKKLLGLYDLAELDVPEEPQQPSSFFPLDRLVGPKT